MWSISYIATRGKPTSTLMAPVDGALAEDHKLLPSSRLGAVRYNAHRRAAPVAPQRVRQRLRS